MLAGLLLRNVDEGLPFNFSIMRLRTIICFSHNVYERSVEINEQLSRNNSLNAFCYRLN